MVYSDEIRADIATRLSGGQSPNSISETLGIALKTVYRLRKAFVRDGDAYIATPLRKPARTRIDREKLSQLIAIMTAAPKTTLKELMRYGTSGR